MDAALLYFALACAFVSFLCSTYTTLRTLLPNVPDHPLKRRRPPVDLASSKVRLPNPDAQPRSKSAQRFTAYLALTDVFAMCVLLWEVVCATSSSSHLGSSELSDSRIYLATTARPTLLLIVAVLSYANVIRGRSISLGPADCIVWGPALVLYAVGAGLASLALVDGHTVWIGLVAWLSSTTLVVTFCFTRLLVAILRVRSSARQDQACTLSENHQEERHDSPSEHDLPYHQRYSLNFPNFSGLSTNFVNGIGRSSSPQPSTGIGIVSLHNRGSLALDQSRRSHDLFEEYDFRSEFRSPTPGSTYGLLYRSTNTAPVSCLSRSSTPYEESGRREESLAVEPVRRSIGESIASRASTYFVAGGRGGNTTVRDATIKEAWKDQTPPGSGHAPKVELSDREARGAITRLGGHLASSVLGFALISPSICLRATGLSPNMIPSVASFLLVAGVCQSSLALALQCWTSEGFWFRKPSPPVVTSSSAIESDGVEVVSKESPGSRSTSRTSTWKDSMPGIRPDGEDCDGNRKGRVGRALSILSAHPKLQLLDDGANSFAATSSYRQPATTSGHVRLRSLKLSKGTIATMGTLLPGRPRAGSAESRKTVGGFEHGRNWSTPVNDFDKAIAMQLLASRTRTPDSTFVRQGPVLASTTQDFEFNTREASISPASSRSAATPPKESTRPISIDYLSAQVLPSLVPSLRIGRDIDINPSSDPIAVPPRPNSSLPTKTRSKIERSLSLSLATNEYSERDRDQGANPDNEVWIAVEGDATGDIREGEVNGEHQIERELAEVEPISNATLINHERSGSSATRLDISFDWEAVDETEDLCIDDGALAEETSHAERGGPEDQAISRNDARGPLSPFLPYASILPFSLSHGVASRPRASTSTGGSTLSLNAEDQDVHTSTIQCASIRPVVRSHENTESIGSTRSLSDVTRSSITSQGFKHLLESAGTAWHTSSSGGAIALAKSEDGPLGTSHGRRPLPAPPLEPGLRPLSLLGQRDFNRLSSATTLDGRREVQKPTRDQLARSPEPSSCNLPAIPLPPIPTVIEEVDEDRKSGTPTPKSRRTPRAHSDEAAVESNENLTPSRVPAKTPPNVTRRNKSKLRRHGHHTALSTKNAENVRESEVGIVNNTNRSLRSPAVNHSARNMR